MAVCIYLQNLTVIQRTIFVKIAVALSTMTVQTLSKIKLIENANGIFKIEKMTKIRSGMAEMQAKTCGVALSRAKVALRMFCYLYMTAEMVRQKCLRDVFRCFFAMPGPILFIFSFF
jgi:hypothetical protein